MKFCQICGRPLQDGEVCNCQAQQAPQQPVQQQYQQPVQPQYQQPVQQPYAAQPQYQQPAQPKQDGKFVKALKNIPVAFKSYFKNSEKVIETAKAKKDFLLPLLYIAILFLINLILGICFFARMSGNGYYAGLGVLQGVFGGFFFKFNFGLVLLAALIITVVECVLYTGARFLAQVIFAKKPAGQAILDSFIEFGFHSIPLSCLVLVGALLGLITAWLLVPFLGFAASYLVVTYVTATLKDAEGFQNKLVRNIIMAGTVMLCIALIFWMLYVVCSMNYSFTGAASYSDLGGYGNLGSYGDLLNGLGSLSSLF